MLKLASASIDPSQFAYGAFGDESERREDVVALAILRAADLAGDGVRAVVVGDTPLDFGAARANGALAALVGTGPGSFEQIASLEPDFLARDLGDPGTFLGWLARLSG
jgi:phosphoglycolate phosphatase-like HAD superfamily hydrolase